MKTVFLHIIHFMVFFCVWASLCMVAESADISTNVTMLVGYITATFGLWVANKVVPGVL